MARNFNAKLSRLIKKNPENRNILPQFYNENTEQFESKVTIDMLKDVINSRQDYNRMINMLKRFSRKGSETIVESPYNEYGTRTTKWQRQEMNRLAGIVNRRRQARLDRLNMVEMMNSEGELGYTLGQMFGMGLASINKLQPTRAFTPSQSQADLKYKQRALLKEASTQYHRNRDEILKDNYIKALSENYAADDIKDVVKSIRNMNPDLFVLKFEARGDKFEMAYPPGRGSEQYNSYVSELKSYWNSEPSILDAGSPVITTLLNQ